MRWIEHERDLIIIGLPLRTSPTRAATDIPAHWRAFLSGGPPPGDIHAVYCDYASDWRGEYTMVLGTAVDAGAPVPAGQRRVRVPSGRYAAFDAEGDPARVVWKTWMHINTEWADRDKRRYIADYERYLKWGADGVRVEVVVGVA